MNTISVALVDDHRVVTRSLKAYLESFPGLRVAGLAATGEELLERLPEWKPLIVLMDLLLPGGMDGVETTRRICARAPERRGSCARTPIRKSCWPPFARWPAAGPTSTLRWQSGFFRPRFRPTISLHAKPKSFANWAWGDPTRRCGLRSLEDLA